MEPAVVFRTQFTEYRSDNLDVVSKDTGTNCAKDESVITLQCTHQENHLQLSVNFLDIVVRFR